jgi:hypothetical protein
MKIFLILMAMTSTTVFAQPNFALMKFGSIGPEKQSLPTPNSSAEAKKVFQSLKSEQIGKVKLVDSKEALLKCTDYSDLFENAYSCEMLLKLDLAQIVEAQSHTGFTTISLGGDVAEQIWKQLLVTTTTTRGVSVKSVGNLSCSKPRIGANKATRCSFSRVIFSRDVL